MPRELRQTDLSSGLCLGPAFPQDNHLHGVPHIRHLGVVSHTVVLLHSHRAARRAGRLGRVADRTCDARSSEVDIVAVAVVRLAVVLAVEDS